MTEIFMQEARVLIFFLLLLFPLFPVQITVAEKSLSKNVAGFYSHALLALLHYFDVVPLYVCVSIKRIKLITFGTWKPF